MNEEIESEFGSISPINWLKPENVKMYDSDGNIILCKCGKPAGSGAMGKKAFIAWCSDCSPINQSSAKFVYRPPKE